ncbi:zinc finger protein 27-like isoform X3 [Plodia interpunctella]|uniref:zinc finger protein 27-like isoform X3 n=1 Tax=Plodia interpunctella TaxID=58824 RepID=UPI002368CA7D|nr:zinc finger protein 27-like isoform X3 [Plodia interpunctella]
MNNGTEQIFLVNSTGTESSTIQKPDANSDLTLLDLENVQDFSTVCRICATTTDFLIPIFEGEGLQNDLADKINKHLPIQVRAEDRPRLPSAVCGACGGALLRWHALAARCARADRALRDLMEQESSKSEQNKSESAQLFYENVNNILREYLKSIHMDGEISIYICQGCPDHEPLTDVNSLAEHIRRQHLITEKNYLRTFIQDNIVFEETLNLDNYDRDSNSETEDINDKELLPNFFCPFCENIFSSTTRLICHLNTHIEVCIEKGITCCDTDYNNKKTFVDHLQDKHVERLPGDVENVCRSCGYQASDGCDLQTHVNANHDHGKETRGKKKVSAINQKNIPAVCPECNKTFSNKYNMFVHMKSHTAVKYSYRCEQCDKTYSSQWNLAYHRKHSHIGIMDHICSYCGEKFPTKKSKDIHIRIHTGHKPFQCSKCGKSFRAKNSLDRHMDMHLDIRKYACHVCPMRFRKRSHLNYHLKTHKKK